MQGAEIALSFMGVPATSHGKPNRQSRLGFSFEILSSYVLFTRIL